MRQQIQGGSSAIVAPKGPQQLRHINLMLTHCMTKFTSRYFLKKTRLLKWLQHGPLFLGLGLLVGACSSDAVKNLDHVPLQDAVGIERAEGVELHYSDSAVVRVIVHAPTLLRYIAQDTPKQTFPDGLDADFYNQYQQQTSKLVANYAEQFEREQRVYLRDSVRIWNKKGEMLETDELIWDKLGERISSTERVRIVTPTQIINGIGFSSNLDFSAYEIYQVTGMVERETMVETPF